VRYRRVGGFRPGPAEGLLPDTLLHRRKSMYPGVANPAYEQAIDTHSRLALITGQVACPGG